MAEVKRLVPDDRRQPKKPGRGEHPIGAVGRPGEEQRKSGRTYDNAVSSRAAASSAAAAARRAARLVGTLSGSRPESVISIERTDGGWRVGVEVVEVARIPDSADILAVYEVCLGADGELTSYRRVRRYARGQVDWEHRR